MIKLKRFDVFLLIALLLLSVTTGLLSYRLYLDPDSSTTPKVGVLQSAQGDFFRKSRDSFFYSNIQTHAPIFDLDQITTGIDSNASIQFDQGSQIQIQELSHILISVRNDTYSLDIKSGNIQANLTNEQALLLDGTRVIAPYGGAATVKYNKGSDESEIEVLDGQVQISENGKSEILSNNNGKTKFGRADSPLAPLELIQPLNNAVVFNPTGMIELSWQNLGENIQYSVVLIQNDQAIQTYEVTDTSIKISLPTDSSYQWKVTANNPRKFAQSTTASFVLSSKEPFAMIEPKQNTTFKIKDPETQATVPFKYESQLNETWVFLEDLQTQEVTSQKEPFEFKRQLGNSSYRWGLSEDQAVTPRTWNSFTILKVAPPKVAKPTPTTTLPPPVTTRPPPPPPPPVQYSANGIEVPRIVKPYDQQRLQAQGETTKLTVVLSSSSCRVYEVEVDATSKFTLPFIRRTSTLETHFDLPKGTYYFHARCWKTGDMGDWSPTIKAQIK